MTDFEKTIKREMTREKFEEIRDHVYGDGKNTYSYTYGDVASWLTWNRDENGNIASVEPPPGPDFTALTARFGMYDGRIDKWEQDKKPGFASRLTTDIVFLGFNMSRDGKPNTDAAMQFQNARGHKFIVQTFKDTAAEGGYFTDIIKSDKRILDELAKRGTNASPAAEVMKIIRERPDIRDFHIDLFKKELDFIGAEKPLLIVYGRDPAWIINKALELKYLEKSRFHDNDIVEIYSYTDYYIPGGLPAYINDTRQKLSKYITIPASGTETKPPKKTGEEKKNTGNTPRPPADPNDLQIKLGKVKEALEEKGYPMKVDWDKRILGPEKKTDKTFFHITLTQAGVFNFHWESHHHNNDKEWFEERLKTIKSKGFTSEKDVVYRADTRLWIDVDQDNYLQSIVDIVEKTSGTMGYYR